jgi:hypothetical protein
MIDDKKKAIACKQGKLPAELNSTYKKAFDLMEWQASSLAPRILMPAKMVYVRFQEEWKTISADYPNALKGRIMELVIERLADFFKVSKQAAKIRLIEIGVDNAAGTSNYINGKYYPSFYFKSHSLEKNQTYVIDFLDAVIQIRTNPKLRELSRQGKLAYANGMVVLNQKKYVSLDENGETVLTEYALEHVDECAFIFSKNPGKSNGVYNSYIESVCFLCRSEDYGEYISSNYDDNDVNRNKISYAQETCDEFIEDSYSLTLLKKMNGSFAEDFMVLIKEYEYTHADGRPNYSALKRDIHVDDKTLESYVSGKARPSKQKVLAICAGLRLHSRVAYHLLKKAGIDLQNTMDENDMIYCGLIERHHTEGVEGWNNRINALEKMEMLLP